MKTVLAVEDQLSEAVLRRLIRDVRPIRSDTVTIGLRGKHHLRARARELNRSATRVPVVLMVDQDDAKPCPPGMVTEWLGGSPNARFLFQVAVLEVEAWLLADRQGLARFLAIPENKVPTDVEQLTQPKEFLVNLARRSRSSSLRAELVPQPGSTAAVGPAYNARLIEFVSREWSPMRGAPNSASLQRALRRLTAF